MMMRQIADQTRKEDGVSPWRIENDLAAAGFFGWVWLLVHCAPP
jgi:hypothetical protein